MAEPPGGAPAVIGQRLEAERDELWSFVGKKANRHWVWIAMDATTRPVIAFYVGDRRGQSAPDCFFPILSLSVLNAFRHHRGSHCSMM
jgi:hypothetical protein